MQPQPGVVETWFQHSIISFKIVSQLALLRQVHKISYASHRVPTGSHFHWARMDQDMGIELGYNSSLKKENLIFGWWWEGGGGGGGDVQ